MSHTFFWHDYETFGRSARFDRPSQFAGIRTDAELNEIGEPCMWYCQPDAELLPEPEACLLTGILPQTCAERGIPEPDFAAAIEAQLAQPGTIGVGYNTLRFDDEFTRHLFWRNLIDPYAREWQNGCGRWDLLDLVRATYALRPDGIEWPVGDDGKTSFKLERLSKANGLLHEAAHDALSDVRATIAMARLIRQKHPRLFDFAFKLHKKEAAWAEIGSAPRPLLHVSGRYGVERGCIAIVWPLGPHPRNKNELIVWDLSSDPSELFDLRPEAIRARLFVARDDLPEGVSRLAIKTLHVNKSPFVCASLQTLSAAQAERWGMDRALALKHAAQLQEKGNLLDGLWSEVFLPPEGLNDLEPEANLYGGFVPDADRRLLQQVRQWTAEQLAQRVQEGRLHFSDPRLETLLWHYRARHHSAFLTPEEGQRWLAERAQRLHQTGRTTIAAYLERLDVLQSELENPVQQALLEGLVDWVETIAPPHPDELGFGRA